MGDSKLRKELYILLDETTDETDMELFCINHQVSLNIGRTVYLYLLYSKRDVADMMSIDESTVIRRVKKFIEKTKEV